MKIGDQVSVVNEDLKGEIKTIHKGIVVVQDDHGFNHKVPKDQIILRDESLYKAVVKIEKTETSIVKSKKHQKKHLVLDLHFENLVKNPLGYDSFERYFIQKEKLIETIDFCRANRIKKLEIIHGIGDGTLQNIVYDVLESQINIDFHNKEILHQQSGSVMVFFV